MQKLNNCFNIPSSQTFTSYLPFIVSVFLTAGRKCEKDGKRHLLNSNMNYIFRSLASVAVRPTFLPASYRLLCGHCLLRFIIGKY
jgi:hypothetical protein